MTLLHLNYFVGSRVQEVPQLARSDTSPGGSASNYVKLQNCDIHGQGIPEFKQVELYKNYRKFMLSKHYEEVMCPKPDESILKRIKTEKVERRKARIEKKAKVQELDLSQESTTQ
jgi:hypothetical protein